MKTNLNIILRRAFSYCILLYTLHGVLFAQDISSGALFLNLPHNVHQHSSGDSASLIGLDGINVNPASTTLPKSSYLYYLESAVNISQLPGNLIFSNISFLYWFGDLYGTFASTIGFLHYGDISIVDENGNPEGQTSAYDLYVGLNYSRKFFYDILLGVNVKIIQQKLHTFNAFGFAVDFGIKKRFNIQRHTLWLSLSGNHFGPEVTFDQAGNPLPSKINGSISYILKDWLPEWLHIELGPQFNYFLEGYYNITLGSQFLFDLSPFHVYILTRYRYNSVEQNQFSIGTGGSYQFNIYKLNLSFGINPIANGLDLVTSLKFVYQFGTKTLSKVKPVDFSTELDYDNLASFPKDNNEIIIQLDEPVFEKENNERSQESETKNGLAK